MAEWGSVALQRWPLKQKERSSPDQTNSARCSLAPERINPLRCAVTGSTVKHLPQRLTQKPPWSARICSNPGGGVASVSRKTGAIDGTVVFFLCVTLRLRPRDTGGPGNSDSICMATIRPFHQTLYGVSRWAWRPGHVPCHSSPYQTPWNRIQTAVATDLLSAMPYCEIAMAASADSIPND